MKEASLDEDRAEAVNKRMNFIAFCLLTSQEWQESRMNPHRWMYHTQKIFWVRPRILSGEQRSIKEMTGRYQSHSLSIDSWVDGAIGDEYKSQFHWPLSIWIYIAQTTLRANENVR